MEKTIQIGEKAVRLKATASFALKYRRQFGEEPIRAFMGLLEFLPELSEGNHAALLGRFDSERTLQVIWAMASNADDSLPPLEEWLDSFEDGFPVLEVLPEVINLLLATSYATVESKKKHPAPTKRK